MIYYFCFIFFFFLSCFKRVNESRRLIYFCLVPLAVFLCFSYMCGSDWRSYEMVYQYLDWRNPRDIYTVTTMEFGFVIYMSLFKILNIDFWCFFILTKLICFCIIFGTILKISQKNFFLTISFFIVYYAYFLFIDCPLRNLIAVAISMFAFQAIEKKKFIFFALWIALAMVFHTSACIIFLCYFFLGKDIKNSVWIIAFAIVNILFFSKDAIIYLLSFFGDFFPYVSGKLESYLLNERRDGQGKIFSIGLLINFIIFVFLLLKKKQLKESGIPYFNTVFNSAILFIIIYRFGITVQIFSRIMLYFSIFYSCMFIYLISLPKQKIYHFLMLIMVFLFCCYVNLRVFRDFRYIPYTNILFNKSLSYEERFFYNYENSPYVSENDIIPWDK